MTYPKLHDRIATAARLAAFGDVWPTRYADDVEALLAAAESGRVVDRERLATIRDRVIDARGSYPWPGGRWAGWYADDAGELLEDLAVAA